MVLLSAAVHSLKSFIVFTVFVAAQHVCHFLNVHMKKSDLQPVEPKYTEKQLSSVSPILLNIGQNQ